MRAWVNRFCLVLAAWAFPALAVPAVAAPQRIVSINACADQLLLALADPAQIAALSRYAADPTYSYLSDQARAFPHDAGAAETVIQRDPDLVLAGRFTKRETRAMLKRLGFNVVELDTAKSIDDSIAQVRAVAALLGHPERGEALVARIEAARAKAAAAVPPDAPRPTVAVYQRRGYVTGQNTLSAELLRLAGFADMGGQLAGRTGGFVPLERIVTDRPDLLVMADPQPVATDQGIALMAHPALQALYPPERRVALSTRLTNCGGPSLPEAIETLVKDRIAVGASMSGKAVGGS